jgi:pimeloyl-ACP methyl ester carboxylesterase
LTGPASDDQYGIESYVSDLSLVIEHLGIDSCDLVGHSMGGRIAVKYSMENPDRVRNLVLLAASGTPRENEGSPPLAMKLMKNPLGRFLIKRMWSRKMAKDTLIDMVHDGSLVTDEEVDRMWEFSRYPGSMDAMFREFGMVWDDFAPEEIEKIATNTLLIWGEEDTICPVDMGMWYNSHLPNSTFIRLPEIGHNPQFECPGVCLDEISSWLGTH